MAKQKVTKEKVIKTLVKWGWNENDANNIVTSKAWEYAQRYYAESTCAQIAELLATITI